MIKPYFETKLGKLYCGDCLEIIPKLESVDLVLTDPPFNVGKDFANDNLSDKKWDEFCNAVAVSILNSKASNILIEINKKDNIMRQTLDKIFQYRYAICLNYTNSMRQGTVGYHNWGLVLWYGIGKCYNRYKDRIDSLLHNTKNKFSHPSPKEIGHYKKLCEMFSRPDDLILDPFLGSGTTAIACENLNRKWIGIEIEEKYCEIAAKRIDEIKFGLQQVSEGKEKEGLLY